MSESEIKMGAPVKEIDWDEFDKLCGIQCTLPEIAGWFRVSEDTIERRVQEKFGQTFADISKQKRSTGKVSLRRKQFQAALESNNTALLIWLGKQYLGQVDKAEFSSSPDRPFVLKYSADKLDEPSTEEE